MNLSPVQLQAYFLERVRVEAREGIEGFRPPGKAQQVVQEWSGVTLNQHYTFGWADDQEADPRNFALRLRIEIRNEGGTLVPHNIDVEVVGYFELQKDVPLGDREDLAKVNGAAMLYGVIRDTVYSITARSQTGPCILPTVNFLDLRAAKKDS